MLETTLQAMELGLVALALVVTTISPVLVKLLVRWVCGR